MKIEPVTSYDQLMKLAPLWNDLLSQSDSDEALMTFEWFSSCWKAYGKDSDMMVFLVRENHDLVGIFPLMRKKIKWRGLPTKVIYFISKPSRAFAHRSGFIVRGARTEAFAEVLNFMKRHGYGFDMLHLFVVVKDSLTYQNIKSAVNIHQLNHFEFPGRRSPYIQVRENWQDYKAHRSRKLKHKLNRLGHLFTRHGSYEIMKHTQSEIENAMGEVLSVSRKTWKYPQGTAMASNPQDSAFYQHLAREASHRGWLNLWVLKLNGKPIAYVFNLVYKNRIFALDIGYDTSYAKYSPGLFLIAHVIKDCFENGLSEYDWLGSDLPFKMVWSDSFREHADFWIFSNSLYGKTLAAFESKVKPFLKKSPFLKGIAQKIK